MSQIPVVNRTLAVTKARAAGAPVNEAAAHEQALQLISAMGLVEFLQALNPPEARTVWEKFCWAWPAAGIAASPVIAV